MGDGWSVLAGLNAERERWKHAGGSALNASKWGSHGRLCRGFAVFKCVEYTILAPCVSCCHHINFFSFVSVLKTRRNPIFSA